MLTGVYKHANCFEMFLLDIFSLRRTTDLFSFNLKHDLTVGINYKINVITSFACAYSQHDGVKEKSQENAIKHSLLFQVFN